jgi:hypothetical protein
VRCGASSLLWGLWHRWQALHHTLALPQECEGDSNKAAEHSMLLHSSLPLLTSPASGDPVAPAPRNNLACSISALELGTLTVMESQVLPAREGAKQSTPGNILRLRVRQEYWPALASWLANVGLLMVELRGRTLAWGAQWCVSFFLVELGYELRALCLQSRCTTS